jgi:hypothetical protein
MLLVEAPAEKEKKYPKRPMTPINPIFYVTLK